MKKVKNDLIYINGFYSFVCDFINDIRLSFKRGVKYYLNMPTGSGKTTLIKHIVSSTPQCRICILVNRSALEEQIISQVGTYQYFNNINGTKTRISDYMLPNNLKIMTYQRLEREIFNPIAFLNCFDIVAFEEIHYVLEDSQFNPKVNISFNSITQLSYPAMIFISATGHRAFSLIEENSVFNNESNYFLNLFTGNKNKGHVKSFRKMDELKKMIVRNATKWLIFVNSKNEGKKLTKFLQEQGISCAYIDTENVDNKTYHSIVCNEKFDERVCVCTSVLDNGINIKDTNLKQIVIFSDYEIQVKQMYGRKRIIDENDSFDIYLFENTISQLKQKLKQEEKRLNLYRTWYNDFIKYNGVSYLYGENSKFGNLYREAFYMDGGVHRFNSLGYIHIQNNCSDLNCLIQSGNVFEAKVGWLNNGIFQKPIFRPTAIQRETDIGKQQIISEFLNYVDIEMNKEKYEDFRNLFKKLFLESYIGETALRSNRIPSDNVINNCLKEHDYPFELCKLNNMNRVLKQLNI